MPELLQSITIDNALEWLKALGVVVVTVIGYFKRHLLDRRGRTLERRYLAFKALLQEGVEKLHPLLLEAGMASALGHSRLNAKAIRLLLCQDSPLQSMERYLRGSGYVMLAPDGSHFESTVVIRKTWIRRTLATGVFLVYVVFAISALWLLMYGMPQLMQGGKWGAALVMLMYTVLLGFFAVVVLREGSNMQQALALVRDHKALQVPAS